jgi:two-component system, OmpR family, sensor histidine kinase YxdK
LKLFFRDHSGVICLHIVMLFSVLIIYRMAGFRDIKVSLYTVFFGLCLLGGYLVFRYAGMKGYYARLSNPFAALDESISATGFYPMAEALDQLLLNQYQLYENKLAQWEKDKNEHLTFMNQWVHQMKTPLSVIELLLQDDDEVSRESIREEADRIQNGLETVLYNARLKSFEQDFHAEPVKLRELSAKLVQENKRLFIRNAVYPEIAAGAELIVHSDKKWLDFAVSQILINSIKYSKGTNQKVTISFWQEGDTVILEVKDRGHGIPASDIERVFQPFFTGENGRRFPESTGMGLYLVSEISMKLQFQLELESEEGKGTAVRFLFNEPNSILQDCKARERNFDS